MSTNTTDKGGAARTLADLVNADPEEDQESPPETRETAVEVRRGTPPARRPRKRTAPVQRPSVWQGPVARVAIEREQLNVGLPKELDLLRRLRLFSAVTGVDVQDVVAAAVNEWLDNEGYDINSVP